MVLVTFPDTHLNQISPCFINNGTYLKKSVFEGETASLGHAMSDRIFYQSRDVVPERIAPVQ
jgi:hypothetical protein